MVNFPFFKVLKKNLVFIRDKPAIDHLVYEGKKTVEIFRKISLYLQYISDYRKRKLLPSERLQCPFAMSKEISLKRKRGFVYPKESKWKKLFDPQ
jgi:glutamate receptor, ionotropic, invertebrate